MLFSLLLIQNVMAYLTGKCSFWHLTWDSQTYQEFLQTTQQQQQTVSKAPSSGNLTK